MIELVLKIKYIFQIFICNTYLFVFIKKELLPKIINYQGL